MRRAKSPRFYVYRDKKTGERYFHNAVTNEITWSPPEKSIFIDPTTMEEIKIENKAPAPNNIEEIKLKKPDTFTSNPPKKHRNSINSCEQVAGALANSKRRLTRKSTLLVTLNANNSNISSNLTSSNIPIYLPQDISKDSKEYDVRGFAVTHFNTRTKGSIFNKKEIPPDELLLYSTDSSVLPLLKTTPNNLKKKCEEIFNLVLEYCKQNPKAQPCVFVEILNKEHALIDETFIILLKLIRNNPSEDNTARVWDIILTICTFFPPSKTLQPLIRHVVAVEALGTKPSINSIAKIAYIRLAARCDCGEIFPMQPKNWTNLIPTHPVQDSFVFGAPLLELIYAQRRSSPKCTIPLFMHRFAHELFNAGCQKVEGTFRLPGNKVQIDLMVEEIHNGKEVFKDAELRDLASLFKRWLADLPEPIVPMSMYNQLVDALDKNTVMDFVETLPKVNHDTLGYLVGFLQEFVKAADVTLMGIVPVSMIFGANVVRIVSNDQMVMKTMTDNGRKFMEFLLKNWDVSFIYPLPLDFIT